MNRTATMSPGKINRRFILLALVLGFLGAIFVYVAFNRSDSGGGGGGAVLDSPVVVAKVEIPARTRILPAMVETKFVAKESRSLLAFEDQNAVVGQVTRFPISMNEQILSNKVVPLNPGVGAPSRALSFVIPPGKRAFAMPVSEVVTVGGLVLPGDYIDILILWDVPFRPLNSAETLVADNYVVQTIFQNIEVLAVAQSIVDTVQQVEPNTTGQRTRNTEARPEPGAGTVTLALTPEQAERLLLAETKGTIRYALRPFGEGEEGPIPNVTEIDLFRGVPSPFTSR